MSNTIYDSHAFGMQNARPRNLGAVGQAQEGEVGAALRRFAADPNDAAAGGGYIGGVGLDLGRGKAC